MGWVVACLLAVFLISSRRQLKRLTPAAAESSEVGPEVDRGVPLAYQHLHHLIVLRLELRRLHEAGDLNPDRYVALTEEIDALGAAIVRQLGAAPHSQAWLYARDTAWELLATQAALQEQPPWMQATAPGTSVAVPQADVVSRPASVNEALRQRLTIPPPPQTDALPRVPPPIPLESLARPQASTQAAQLPPPLPPSSPEDSADYAWEPAAPSVLERALQTISGWPALLAPFLLQNIGWFIGGLCFVAGSVFLVAYTTGFAKTLTSFAVLALYTLLLLCGGYQIRRRQAALEMSSNALLMLGMLLVPLNVAAAVRLLLVAQQSPGLIALGLLAAGLGVGGVYATAILVSGIMHRTLQRHHPRLFLALSTIQFAVPLLAHWPSWPWLAVCHGILTGLLAYGLVRFTRDWLHSILSERRKLAYYAAGTLLYAALVSFVHVTWGYTEAPALPRGYYGPLLMVLCCLLFYVDAYCKRWSQQTAFLSHLSFGIYGLSIIAVLLAMPSPAARLCTLALATLLYGFVTWQYATLPPLYLLLGCVGWFYHGVVLRHFPYDWYFLASLPGLAALWAANRWVLQHHATAIALVGYRVWLLGLLGVTAWSLGNAQPGWVAFTTALVFMGLAFTAPRVMPPQVFGSSRSARMVQPIWLYLGTCAGLVAAAYAPPTLWLVWVEQFLCSLLFLAALWAALGLRLSRIVREHAAAGCEALLNSAVLCLVMGLVLAVLLALLDMPRYRTLPFLLGLEGGLALWLSLVLGVQWLFYGALGLWGVAGVIVKLTYFPFSGSGITIFCLACIVWVVVWWVERRPSDVVHLRQERAALRAAQSATLTLLWVSPVAFAPLQVVVGMPLRQTMVLLWGLGLSRLGMRLVEGQVHWRWVASASLGTLLTLLLAGTWPQAWLLPVAMGLGLGVGLGTALQLGVTTVLGYSVVVAVYALLAWRLGAMLLAHVTVQRWARAGHLQGDRLWLESLLHGTAFVMMVLSLVVPLVRHDMFVPAVAVWLTLGTAIVFWGLAGQRYQSSLQRYLVLETGVLGALLGYIWTFHRLSRPLGLWWLQLWSAPGLGMIAVLLSGGLWGMAWFAWQQRAMAAEFVQYHRTPHSALRTALKPRAMAAELAQYHQPLQVVAVQLALMAAMQALGLVAPAIIGWEYAGGFYALVVLGLAGISLLQAPQSVLCLGGLVGIVLALVGAHSMWSHGTPVSALWLGQPLYTDQWFTLAILALGLASLAHYVSREPHRGRRYMRPLRIVAALTYSWALLGAAVLFGFLPLQAAPTLPGVFLILAIGLLPLLQPFAAAAVIRGFGIALLLSAGVVSILASSGWHAWERFALIVWAYGLWSLGNFALPRYNARWPHWAIAAHGWPWIGLFLVCSALMAWGLPWLPVPRNAALHLGGYLTAVALYVFLLLRNSAWKGWPWFAVGTLTLAGLAYNVAWFWTPPAGVLLSMPFVGVALPWRGIAGIISWANILLLAVTAWRRYGATLGLRLAGQRHDLSMPLLACSSAMLTMALLFLGVWEALTILVHTWTATSRFDGWPSILLGLLVLLSFSHVAWLHRTGWPMHGVIAALFCTLLAAWLEICGHMLHPPLFLALWSVLMPGVLAWGTRQQWSSRPLTAASVWCDCSPLAAVVLWVLFPGVPLAEHLMTLAFLGGYAAGLGWQRQHSLWLFAAMIAGVIQLHGWWFVYLSPHHLERLWPWFTLQLAGLTWFVLWAKGQILRRTAPLSPVAQALSWLFPVLVSGALLSWGLHLFYILNTVFLGQHPQWLFGRGDAVAAVLAIVALMTLGVQQARTSRQDCWTYGVTVLGGTVWGYVRLLWVGLAAVQVWDTVALIAASYALFILHRMTQSLPLLRVVMLLPLLAVVTVPMQEASVHASVALWMAALLYMGLRQTTGRALPLYMGILTLNVGIYLWVPEWAHTSRMLQLYTIPAALSILWLLHAHRHELRPSVLHACRLAASSVLYASATLDVFLQSDLRIFLAALGVSLAGVIIGIALRTRAFLYAGTSFFVLNVLGQLLLFFPEQRLSRAIVFLVLGTLITGSMIWFNMQREAILQRLHLARAELTTWQ